MKRWLGYPVLGLALVLGTLGSLLLVAAVGAEWVAEQCGGRLRNPLRLVLGTSDMVEVSPSAYDHLRRRIGLRGTPRTEMRDGQTVEVLDLDGLSVCAERV